MGSVEHYKTLIASSTSVWYYLEHYDCLTVTFCAHSLNESEVDEGKMGYLSTALQSNAALKTL
jgi:hypothetical protein